MVGSIWMLLRRGASKGLGLLRDEADRPEEPWWEPPTFAEAEAAREA